MPRPMHFEINSKNPEKAVAFYRNAFGWTINKWDGPADYWLIQTGKDGEPGINGALFNSGNLFTGTVNTIDVEDIDAAMQKVKANGGQIVNEKQAVPGVGYHVYCRDTEGVLFGLMQNDPNAGM